MALLPLIRPLAVLLDAVGALHAWTLPRHGSCRCCSAPPPDRARSAMPAVGAACRLVEKDLARLRSQVALRRYIT